MVDDSDLDQPEDTVDDISVDDAFYWRPVVTLPIAGVTPMVSSPAKPRIGAAPLVVTAP